MYFVLSVFIYVYSLYVCMSAFVVSFVISFVRSLLFRSLCLYLVFCLFICCSFCMLVFLPCCYFFSFVCSSFVIAFCLPLGIYLFFISLLLPFVVYFVRSFVMYLFISLGRSLVRALFLY